MKGGSHERGARVRNSYRFSLVSLWGTGAVLAAAMVMAGVAGGTATLIFLVVTFPFALNAWQSHRDWSSGSLTA